VARVRTVHLLVPNEGAGESQGSEYFSGAMDEEGSKMRTLTYCDAKITSTRTAAGSVQGGKHTLKAALSWILQPSK